jgi:hypothetical protein
MKLVINRLTAAKAKRFKAHLEKEHPTTKGRITLKK